MPERLRLFVVALVVGACAAACSGSSGSSLADAVTSTGPGVRPEAGGTTVPPTTAQPTARIDGPERRDLTPYEGVGTWVDVFDYAPAFQHPDQEPAVTPASVVDMAALGVRTLYLQATREDPRSPGPLVDDRLVARFLTRAHRYGVRVVAWYLPKLADVDVDLRRLRTLLDYEVDGQRFDGVAVDIEEVTTVQDAAERSRRVVELSRRLHDVADGTPLGAVVLPPVAMEVVNTAYWPQFPWREIRDFYDVWLPMSYWTTRTAASGYHDGYRYTDENIRRMLANLGVESVPLAPIGGIGDLATSKDYKGFVRAAREHAAIGWSIYDWATSSSASWEHLRPR